MTDDTPNPAPGKPCFAAIPVRALSDPRMSLLKLRLLGAVAAHDRMGKGQGCWASSTRLAQMIGSHPVVVRRYITLLVTAGYLEREQADTNPNRRKLRVVYSEADWAMFNCQGVTASGYTSPDHGDQGVTNGDQGVTTAEFQAFGIARRLAL